MVDIHCYNVLFEMMQRDHWNTSILLSVTLLANFTAFAELYDVMVH